MIFSTSQSQQETFICKTPVNCKNNNKSTGKKMDKKITVNKEDFDVINPKLQSMIYSDFENENLQRFAELLDAAEQVNGQEQLAQIVTLDSEIELRDTETQAIMNKKLVMPPASYELQELSVFTPVGIAVFGRKVGDIVKCKVPAGIRTLEIKSKVDSQVKAGFI